MTQDASSASRRQFVGTAAAFALAALPGLSIASAQRGYPDPNRPITIIVPFAAGGGTDIVARLLGNALSQHWGATVMVDNRPGAGGQIGNNAVARAAPDGYTLLLGITTLIQAPSLYQNLPYDVFNDFTPLAQLATSTNFFVVPAASPASSFEEFMTLAKAKKGQLNFGSNGNAGTSHLQGSLLNSTHDLGMVHIPYAGSGPLLTALLGEQVDCAFVDIAPLRPHIASGSLKVLACTGPARTAGFPKVATLSELGLPGFEPVGWFALFGPAGLPDPIRQRLSSAIVELMQSPDIVKRVQDLGLTPSPVSPTAFERSLQTDARTWHDMVEAGNIRIE